MQLTPVKTCNHRFLPMADPD